MNYTELAFFGAVIIGVLLFVVLTIAAPRRIGSAGERLVDSMMFFLAFMIVIVCSVFAFTVIVLHDPSRAAAFNPCDHPKPHKRPADCPK